MVFEAGGEFARRYYILQVVLGIQFVIQMLRCVKLDDYEIVFWARGYAPGICCRRPVSPVGSATCRLSPRRFLCRVRG